ncbi:MAG: hypothetical protein CL661_11925 [Bacteroidetes bacterium]|nr:hypothetical protein [Bacteroidota bacterium]MAE09446.1 hypothetical protein [Bacteroidota bacterium]|tara:strand:- start:252 stop:1223 length:972 start_codon:yes stop_codon:yes gene_type:complete
MKKTTLKFLAIAMFFLMGTFVMAQTQYSITFQVDMTDADPFDPATDEIFMSSSFAGWPQPGTCAGCVMEPTGVGSMIYTNSATIDSGEVQYKYFRVINGEASWDHGEWTGDPNRKVHLAGDGTFENVWANKPYDITFNVDMTTADPFDPALEQVFIAGSLANGWAEPGTLSPYMMTSEDDITFTVTLLLYPGDYMFKYFIVPNGGHSWDGGEWAGDPNREVTVDTMAAVIDDVWGDISAGIFTEKNPFTYNLYPNPVTTSLNLYNISDVTKIEVYDITGKLVRTVQLDSAQEVSIDVADLNVGVYIVNVYNDSGVQTAKFVKE